MGIQRSSFYNWRHSCMHPSRRRTAFLQNITLFLCYHKKFPSHGYRWLNAKIRLDTGRVMSNPYAHKCCKAVGIKCESRRCHYWKPGARDRVFPNLLMAGLNITGPLQCVVSDMTVFRVKDEYYELTLYMDLWDNEILAYSLSSKRGDRETYLSGLRDLLELKAKCPDCKMVLHTDQGSV